MRHQTVTDLRRNNRARVLRHVLLATGSTSRSEIARHCRLSAATAATVVADLIEEGLVTESGTVPSDGGRPTARLIPVASSAYMLGVDVGEAGVTVELFDLDLRRHDRVFVDVPAAEASPASTGAALTAAVDTIRGQNRSVESLILGVGLGLPGIVSLDKGTPVVHAQSMGWIATPVASLLPDCDIPVYAENGAKTLALAEVWTGAAKGVQNGIVALIGRGLGVGITTHGRSFRGATSSAGEWGHTKISVGGPTCRCGARGCLEAYIGGDAIVRRWLESEPVDAPESYGEALDLLLRRADDGDEVAVRCVDEAVTVLSIGLANLVNLYNPEQVVIGGWAGLSLFAAREKQIDFEVRQQSLAQPAADLRIVAAQLGGDGVALGAALLPVEQLIEIGVRRSRQRV